MRVKCIASAIIAATLVISTQANAKQASKKPSFAKYEDVSVGATVLRVPYPQGFCKPAGDDAANLQVAAAGDTKNVTLLALIECKRNPETNAYVMIKAPANSLSQSFERKVAIEELSAVMDQSFENSIPDKIKSAAEDRSKASGVTTKIAGTFRPRGHDDVCVYLGGPMTLSAEGGAESQAIGACMTVVGSKLLTLTAYQDSVDPQGYERLLPKLKSWALKISPRP